ncbi:MAG TPA: metalloregulator ArsR/SmtB family transcription factor [Blastocatellia bacterium]|nr:metalloregulator ArsR/SmtB family transcription factor [Blastocatellia bacterium]
MSNRRTASSSVYHAIADPTRRGILDLLRGGEQPVNFLCLRFGISQSAVSQHLRVLLLAGLVSERRVGRQRLYKLEAAALIEVADWVGEYEQFWREKLGALGAYLDKKEKRKK